MRNEETRPSTAHQPSTAMPHPNRRAWRWLKAFGSAVGFTALALVLWAVEPGSAQRDAEGWGAEAARASSASDLSWLPMAPANACGLGASSCFKCHNGKRADAPNTDPVKAPWHAQHAKVDNSCVGCHKGNPRVMKQELAHAKMIAKPKDNSQQSCSTCHTADLAKVQGAYTGGK
jgi:hypothetical protein